MVSKISTILFFIFSIFLRGQTQSKKIDSLIIEASKDPGSGPDYYLIKIFPKKREFKVEYKFYVSEDIKGYNNDPETKELRIKYDTVKFKNKPQSYFDKLTELRIRHTKFNTRVIVLRNKNYKDFLNELYKISNLTKKDIEKEKDKNSMYIHGIGFSFDFFKSSGRNDLYASALEKDNFPTLYNFLVKCLDLYRNKNPQDEIFKNGTFKY